MKKGASKPVEESFDEVTELDQVDELFKDLESTDE